jgi:hypothetical protein
LKWYYKKITQLKNNFMNTYIFVRRIQLIIGIPFYLFLISLGVPNAISRDIFNILLFCGASIFVYNLITLLAPDYFNILYYTKVKPLIVDRFKGKLGQNVEYSVPAGILPWIFAYIVKNTVVMNVDILNSYIAYLIANYYLSFDTNTKNFTALKELPIDAEMQLGGAYNIIVLDLISGDRGDYSGLDYDIDHTMLAKYFEQNAQGKWNIKKEYINLQKDCNAYYNYLKYVEKREINMNTNPDQLMLFRSPGVPFLLATGDLQNVSKSMFNL